MPNAILEESINLVGYETELFEKDDFLVIGYSALHQPDTPDFELWERLRDDGRLESLITASGHKELFGCSSGDAKATAGMTEGSYRHTVCIEVAKHINIGLLKPDQLFQMQIATSKWISYNMKKERFYNGKDYPFWKDNPYGMVKRLGYQFNWKLALHMDVFIKPDIGIFHSDDPVDRQKLCISGCRLNN